MPAKIKSQKCLLITKVIMQKFCSKQKKREPPKFRFSLNIRISSVKKKRLFHFLFHRRIRQGSGLPLHQSPVFQTITVTLNDLHHRRLRNSEHFRHLIRGMKGFIGLLDHFDLQLLLGQF